ncbi:MAG: hypothetical protein CVV27_18070 [Candidatus Melainabacteria bacterium HGW-Melainabacteria-1]|nr:MAG: hypothetical protein CVV27_18070 [Candidatus Melainabacteria bacterium HGW-Melainabacteria-1]
MQNTNIWLIFNLFVLIMLALDLGVFHRSAHVVKVKEALSWSAFWILLALVFNAGVYFGWVPVEAPAGFQGANYQTQAAGDFLTGYLLEKSLSIDNLFVMLLIFNYFKIPGIYQHKILFWGILGALVMRGALILVGAALIHRFEWILYLFGLFLVITGIRMLLDKEDGQIAPDQSPLIKAFKRLMPVTPDFHGMHFFVKLDGRRHATPLFIALLVVEVSDLVFAVDSIPAIFAVTQDPFIVYTSNVFAILGLRSLYFALAAIMDKFAYLKYGLALILSFIGVKMLIREWIHLPSWATLTVVLGTLALSVLASVLWPPKEPRHDSVLPDENLILMPDKEVKGHENKSDQEL